MKLVPWDPDLQTLLTRIKSKDINLQPDFQRGEVWGDPKKKRLIDTILREWHVPPVHVVVEEETELQEVLDGQQRLVAIRDFALGEITVDGNCQPYDEEISALHGKTYEELPDKYRRRFDNYALRVIRITDYRPDEPGELFFRLNQPTSLTAAEQRNAFYGKARAQVKGVVSKFETFGIDDKILGFKNSRMAYDDVVAKVCYSHHVRSLQVKVTAGVVSSLFRSGEPFSEDAVLSVYDALVLFGKVGTKFSELKFNKATFFSWLIFLSRFVRHKEMPQVDELAEFMIKFEKGRQQVRDTRLSHQFPLLYGFQRLPQDHLWRLMDIFNDRAASRVADVSSVLARDLILWIFYFASQEHGDLQPLNPLSKELSDSLARFVQRLSSSDSKVLDSDLEEYIENSTWGGEL